jgi:hypothetical protein
VPYSTKEAGEPTRGTPEEGRRHRNTVTFEGKMTETSGSITVSTKLESIGNPGSVSHRQQQRFLMVENRPNGHFSIR